MFFYIEAFLFIFVLLVILKGFIVASKIDPQKAEIKRKKLIAKVIKKDDRGSLAGYAPFASVTKRLVARRT